MCAARQMEPVLPLEAERVDGQMVGQAALGITQL